MDGQKKRRWIITCSVCGRESSTEQEYTVEDLQRLSIRVREGGRIDTECSQCRLHYAEITGGAEDCEFV